MKDFAIVADSFERSVLQGRFNVSTLETIKSDSVLYSRMVDRLSGKNLIARLCYFDEFLDLWRMSPDFVKDIGLDQASAIQIFDSILALKKDKPEDYDYFLNGDNCGIEYLFDKLPLDYRVRFVGIVTSIDNILKCLHVGNYFANDVAFLNRHRELNGRPSITSNTPETRYNNTTLNSEFTQDLNYFDWFSSGFYSTLWFHGSFPERVKRNLSALGRLGLTTTGKFSIQNSASYALVMTPELGSYFLDLENKDFRKGVSIFHNRMCLPYFLYHSAYCKINGTNVSLTNASFSYPLSNLDQYFDSVPELIEIADELFDLSSIFSGTFVNSGLTTTEGSLSLLPLFREKRPNFLADWQSESAWITYLNTLGSSVSNPLGAVPTSYLTTANYGAGSIFQYLPEFIEDYERVAHLQSVGGYASGVLTALAAADGVPFYSWGGTTFANLSGAELTHYAQSPRCLRFLGKLMGTQSNFTDIARLNIIASSGNGEHFYEGLSDAGKAYLFCYLGSIPMFNELYALEPQEVLKSAIGASTPNANYANVFTPAIVNRICQDYELLYNFMFVLPLAGKATVLANHSNLFLNVTKETWKNVLTKARQNNMVTQNLFYGILFPLMHNLRLAAFELGDNYSLWLFNRILTSGRSTINYPKISAGFEPNSLEFTVGEAGKFYAITSVSLSTGRYIEFEVPYGDGKQLMYSSGVYTMGAASYLSTNLPDLFLEGGKIHKIKDKQGDSAFVFTAVEFS